MFSYIFILDAQRYIKNVVGGTGMDWEPEVGRCKLLHAEWIHTVLLHVQHSELYHYPVINYDGNNITCPELSHTISVIQSRSILSHQSQKSRHHSRQPSCSSQIINPLLPCLTQQRLNKYYMSEWVMLAPYHPPISLTATTAVSCPHQLSVWLPFEQLLSRSFYSPLFSPLITTSLNLRHIQVSSMCFCVETNSP